MLEWAAATVNEPDGTLHKYGIKKGMLQLSCFSYAALMRQTVLMVLINTPCNLRSRVPRQACSYTYAASPASNVKDCGQLPQVSPAKRSTPVEWSSMS